jgi:hypothetical protein
MDDDLIVNPGSLPTKQVADVRREAIQKAREHAEEATATIKSQADMARRQVDAMLAIAYELRALRLSL